MPLRVGDHGMAKMLEHDGFRLRADEIAAYIALSAKKAVESKDLELSQVKRQLADATDDGRNDEIKRLRRRIVALESRFLDLNGREESPGRVDDKDSELEALKQRGRLLERKVEADPPTAGKR